MKVSGVRSELLVLDLQGIEQAFRGMVAGDAVLLAVSNPDPRHATLSYIVRYDDLPTGQSIGAIEQSRKPLECAGIMTELVLIESLADLWVSRVEFWIQFVGQLTLCHELSSDPTEEDRDG